jgi:uncharacterized membrane protein
MRALILALAVACCSLGLLCVDAPMAQDNQHFLLRICNFSGLSAALALANHADASGVSWHSHGWYTVGAGCHDIGTYPKGWFYYYADGAGGAFWGGNSTAVCVAYPGPFDRTGSDGYTCKGGEELKGFEGVFVEAKTGVFTVTLR